MDPIKPVFVYGNLSSKTDMEAAILRYTNDFASIQTSSDAGVGYKAYVPDENSIKLLAADISDYGWVQDTKKNDFEDLMGGGDDITRGSVTTGAALQTLVSKTLTAPYTLTKIMVTFSGDAHLLQLMLNTGVIGEYIVDHLTIDYPPLISANVGDTFYIKIQKLSGADVTAIGFLYGEL